MQPFRFRLDRVLEWRRKKCQIEESRLAAYLGLVHAADLKIERLRVERKSIDQGLLEQLAIPGADFLNLSRYRLRADKEEIELAEERRQRVHAVGEQRTRVHQAQQGVKLLEKLRDRRLQEHLALAAHELEQTAAESYLSRWSQARHAESVKREAQAPSRL
jgi:hypothetical protein